MASLRRARMDELCELVTDGTHESPKIQEVGVPFIKGKNISGGSVDFSSCDYITPEDHAEACRRVKPRRGDILFSNIGSVGDTAVVKDDREFSIKNVALFRPDISKVDPSYFYYLVLSPEFRSNVMNVRSGSAQPFISLANLRSFEVSYCANSKVQQRVAGILSAYDELIENSQRRIRILESMARALYREWFVHFRFPGHENHPRVASPLGEIPQGWEATTVGAHLVALESGKRPKGGIRAELDGVPSIGAENINGIGKHEFTSEKLVPREFFEQMRKGVIRDRDVAIYKDGAYIGKSSYFRDGFPHAECCVNEHVFLVRGDGIRLMQNFLYVWLQEPDTVQAIRSKNANAAQPGINQQTLGGLALILPDKITAAHFDRLVEPLLANIINLAKRIQNVRRTRDLLLPRLLSGQILIGAEVA